MTSHIQNTTFCKLMQKERLKSFKNQIQPLQLMYNNISLSHHIHFICLNAQQARALHIIIQPLECCSWIYMYALVYMPHTKVANSNDSVHSWLEYYFIFQLKHRNIDFTRYCRQALVLLKIFRMTSWMLIFSKKDYRDWRYKSIIRG